MSIMRSMKKRLEAAESSIRRIPVFGTLAASGYRIVKLLPHPRLAHHVHLLFDYSGFHTHAGGYSHARFEQSTKLTDSLHHRIFDILEESQVPFLVFAGHLVGNVRDGRIPLWNEDADVMIFEEACGRFEQHAIPALRRAGFHVVRGPSSPRAFGGYQIIGVVLDPMLTHVALDAGFDQIIRVPRAQVDVFVSRIDSEGFVRNVGGWGRYHSKNVPAEVVLPPTTLTLLGRSLQTYRDPEAGVRLEYGKVRRYVHVYSHFKRYRPLVFVTWRWDGFRRRLDSVIDATTAPTLPGGPTAPCEMERTGRTYEAEQDAPLSEILAELATRQFDEIVLPYPLVLWTLDLRYWFPGIRIVFRTSSDEESAVSRQLEHLVDETITEFTHG